MTHLFVTGMLRSGTTLVQTLLTNHPRAHVAYQPLFQAFIHCKTKFLKEYRYSRVIPLHDMGHGLKEHEEFMSWLDQKRLTRDEALEVFTGINDAIHSELRLITWPDKAPKPLSEILHILFERISEASTHKKLTCRGIKEILCEEYIPFLVHNDFSVLQIIRDPRAVIASASFGQYFEQVGDRYPILMLIRIWRKSAAFWLKFKNHPSTFNIRYEDLLEHPDISLQEICDCLKISSFPEGLANQDLLNEQGKPWQGNSSFSSKKGIDKNSRDQWKSLLSESQIRFIEACTKPELDLMGYDYSSGLSRRDITDFVESDQHLRTDYIQYYYPGSENRRLEEERWDRVSTSNIVNPANDTLFIFPEVYDADINTQQQGKESYAD